MPMAEQQAGYRSDTTKYSKGEIVTVLGNSGGLLKEGETFTGWNTEADGSGTQYGQGATFAMGRKNVTLYARWILGPAYTVTYNGNGSTSGSPPVDTTNYEQGQTVTVLGNPGNLDKSGYDFAGWNFQSDGSGTTYTVSQTFVMGAANVILYAQWSNPECDLVVNYDFGTCGTYTNIYVIWAENSAESFYYPIYICNRLLGIGGTLTNTALPYWKVNKYPHMLQSDIDAVTGATVKKADFNVPVSLPADAPRQFTVFFETDVYHNENDWFNDQPAILYRADIDLDDLQSGYDLVFTGWTANEGTTGDGIIDTGADFGDLQSETRYITNFQDITAPDGFGLFDSRSQTGLIGENGIRIVVCQ